MTGLVTGSALAGVAHVEVGAPQGAAFHIHELRERTAGMARVVFAQHGFIAFG